MKNRILQKLLALSFTLLLALALTACTPQIIINTGESSQEATASTDSTIASTENINADNTDNTDVQTSVASSEEEKTAQSSSSESTASKSTNSKSTSSKSSSGNKTSTSSKISKTKAKAIALKDADVKEADIYDYEIEIDYDNGVSHYDISFEVDGKDYDYEINAETGEIISYEKPKTSTSASTNSKSTSSSTISKSKAKSIALKDADVKETDIYDYEIELDYDNGVSHYDISFEVDGKDYDYEINAETGKIISVDKPKATSSEVQISKSKAKSTALKHAGVSASEISLYEIELEKDNGVWKYEISFNVGNVEYDYTINAENGEIIESEKDIDD